jgi:hypothetical protein
MNTRRTRQIITIPVPFQLSEMQEEWPAGSYEITHEEEAIGDFMYEAYRRITSYIYLPARLGDYGIGKFIRIDPAELDQVTKSRSQTAC